LRGWCGLRGDTISHERLDRPVRPDGRRGPCARTRRPGVAAAPRPGADVPLRARAVLTGQGTLGPDRGGNQPPVRRADWRRYATPSTGRSSGTRRLGHPAHGRPGWRVVRQPPGRSGPSTLRARGGRVEPGPGRDRAGKPPARPPRTPQSSELRAGPERALASVERPQGEPGPAPATTAPGRVSGVRNRGFSREWQAALPTPA